MRTTPDIEAMVTQIVARDIAAGVELARSLGHVMPVEFDIGVRFIQDGIKTRIRMRLDDATYDAIVLLPDLEGRQSLAMTAAMWEAAWERIHANALTLAQVWLDKHPEASIAKEGATKALAILDAMKADEALSARWMKSCAERAKHFKYTTRPRGGAR